MPMTVPPKPAATRQRRNMTAGKAVIEAPHATKPDVDTTGWHANTVRWWNAIWASPISDEWAEADLPALLRLASLEDGFWKAEDVNASVRLAAEIRMQSMQFGLTPMSRRSLQWEIKRVETAKPAAPATKPRDPRLRAVS